MVKLSTILRGAVVLTFISSAALADELWIVNTNGLEDYTSYAAAMSAVNTNLASRGEVVVRGTGNGNLGSFTVIGAANADSSNYLRVEAESTNVWVSGVIAITSQDYTQLSGHKVINGASAITVYNCEGVLVERCCVDNPTDDGILVTAASEVMTVPTTVRNNIVCCGPSVSGIGIQAFSGIGTPGTSLAIVYGNTVVATTNKALRAYTIASGAAAIVNLYATNNFASTIVAEGTGTENMYLAYNASEDGTADDFGGTGAVINAAAADQFINPASNFGLLWSADIRGAGVTVDDTTDFAHTNSWRPQVVWDIGAVEQQGESRYTLLKQFRSAGKMVISGDTR